MPKNKKIAVGIDIGTTYSCVGVYQNGMVKVITDEQGNRVIPSCVAFTSTQRFIGDVAKAQAPANSKNTIFGESRKFLTCVNDH